MVRKSKEGARQAGHAWKESLSAGMKASGESLRGMLSSVTGHLKTAATLGGAISFGGMIKHSIELSDRLGEIAFNVEKATGQAVNWRDLMGDISKVAEGTGRRTGELAEAFDAVFKATGKADVAKAALEPIGKISVATGKNVMELAETASFLTRKFGATADTLPDMLTRFIEKTDAGGQSMDEMGRKFALMAGEANEAGLGGSEGLSTLLGILQQLDSRVGEAASPGLKKLFQTLKEGSGGIKALEKASGVKFAPDTTAFQKMELLLTGKGRKAMEAKLSGESRVVFDELVKPFDEAFERARKSGENTKDATQEGLDAFRGALKDAGKSSLTYQRILDKAADEVKDPAEQMNIALEKLEHAFMQPKLIEAVGALAEKAPALAEGFAHLLEFVIRNPMLSGLAAGAARIVGPGMLGFAGNMISGAMGGGGGGVGGAASGAASSIGNLAKGVVSVASQFGLLATATVGVVAALQLMKDEAEHEALEKRKDRGETVQRALASGRLKLEDMTREQREAVEDAEALKEMGGAESPLAFQELNKLREARKERRGRAAMLGVEGSFFGPDDPLAAKAGGMSRPTTELDIGPKVGGKSLAEMMPKELDLKNPDKVGGSVAKSIASQTLNVRVTNAGDFGSGVGGGGSEGEASKGPPRPNFNPVSVSFGGATPHGG